MDSLTLAGVICLTIIYLAIGNIFASAAFSAPKDKALITWRPKTVFGRFVLLESVAIFGTIPLFLFIVGYAIAKVASEILIPPIEDIFRSCYRIVKG